VLKKGQKNRQVFSTILNAFSSRSHGIFTLKVMKLPIINGEVIEVKFLFFFFSFSFSL